MRDSVPVKNVTPESVKPGPRWGRGTPLAARRGIHKNPPVARDLSIAFSHNQHDHRTTRLERHGLHSGTLATGRERWIARPQSSQGSSRLGVARGPFGTRAPRHTEADAARARVVVPGRATGGGVAVL